ncbi:MAG TPA: hypothetical protein VMN58_08280 [Acidimicrobiales bacterium]|nr:hypothetical protein [Acidimicrobiales bacterium]
MRALTSVAALMAVAGMVACGGDDGTSAATPLSVLDADFVPASILGLEVEEEDVEESLDRRTRTYLDAVGMYSVRDDELLQATLQISRFRDDVDHDRSAFQHSIITQIGSSAPRAYRIGDRTVWLTTGKSQQVTIWFSEGYLYVLGVRDDFRQGRTLLRGLLETLP